VKQCSPSDGPPHPTRVLIVDDDPSMQRMISDYLTGNGIEVACAGGRAEMQQTLSSGRFDLVLLDLRLGSDDGLDLLRELRSRSDLPVIIATGHRRDEIDRVVGLELGADDYLTKPYSLREMLARIRVVLRRVDSGSKPSSPAERTMSYFGSWTLDRRNRRLSRDGGTLISLTKGEYGLLIAFLDAPQRPLSREYLLQATRIHEDIYDRSIDVQILRLRRKLEEDASNPRMLVTERGVGYVFTVPVKTV